MTAQVLHRTLRANRIGDPKGACPILDATGSRLFLGRWNTPSSPIIDACEHDSTAMLEKLAHGGGRLPPSQHFVEIELDAGLTYDVVNEPGHPGWDSPACDVSKACGEPWIPNVARSCSWSAASSPAWNATS